MKKYSSYKNKLEWLKQVKKFSHYFKEENFIENSSYLQSYLNSLEKSPNSSQNRTIGLLCDLTLLYGDIVEQKYHEYKLAKSAKVKIEIRYGSERLHEYENKLKRRPKHKRKSIFSINYWIGIGFTESQAKEKVAEIQSKNSKKRHAKTNNYKILTPLSVVYWKNLGILDEKEIEKLRKPYLDKCVNNLNMYITKYGKEEGERKFKERNKKRLKTMVERYGSNVISSGVSKESLKFLVKLYKILRKNGIEKNDIVWGISNKKEFVLTDWDIGKSYFYDFVVKSKKVIIEYNNLFWHPRKREEWRGFKDYDEAKIYQNKKKTIAISRGYKIYYVWNDEDLNERVNHLTGVILNDGI
jgi:hypothetical protein